MDFSFVLVINCGSSSVKFALYDTQSSIGFKPITLLSEGIAEQINKTQIKITLKQNAQKELHSLALTHETDSFHATSLKFIISKLNEAYSLNEYLRAVGHRVVHGGNVFSESVLICDKVLSQIKDCTELAPLHNPANILGIETLQAHFPKTPQVAVFDTAFHQTLPDYAYNYAIPKQWTEDYQIRRYGFHGTSHRYVTQQAANYLKKEIEQISLITAHLGNGASVTAVRNGKSVDTSMGLTPLEGLVMGTRSGDIDPGLFDYLVNKGLSPKEINQTLNKKSGLLGISGLSHDMRTLCEALDNHNSSAKLALDVFCFRAAKYIAAMSVSLSTIDGVIFTGGIGENAPIIREMIINHLSIIGLKLDNSQNNCKKSDSSITLSIHTQDSHPILVIPTDEEAMIVSDTLNLI